MRIGTVKPLLTPLSRGLELQRRVLEFATEMFRYITVRIRNSLEPKEL